jgi:prepilin-type N-terminal cleavage/methylation domain-containing protein
MLEPLKARTMRARQAGITLFEMMFTIAIAAVLLSIAVPTYADFAARQRLAAASDTLVRELRQARYEAVQRGAALHVTPSAGPEWCVAISTQPGCRCDGGCAMRTIDHRDFVGVQMTLGEAREFDAQQGLAQPGTMATLAAGPRFGTALELSAVGRAKACTTGASMPGFTAC